MQHHRAAYIAEDHILREVGATGQAGRLNYQGWEFSSLHSSILHETDRIQLAKFIRRLYQFETEDEESDSIIASGRSIHIPPMIFSDYIRVSMGGFVLEWNAKDAISGWASQHSTDNVYNLRVVKVPFSQTWSARRQEEALATNEWDWTFSSDYLCTATTPAADSKPVPYQAQRLPTAAIWTAYTGPSRIDTAMLARKDDILFFDEIILYQDDLEDCGEVQFAVKIRVMPTCWFVLARLYLRVDGVEVKLRETRFFYSLSNPAQEVFMEVLWREGKFQDSCLAALSAAQYRDPNVVSQRLPIVNEKYSLQSQYSYSIA